MQLFFSRFILIIIVALGMWTWQNPPEPLDTNIVHATGSRVTVQGVVAQESDVRMNHQKIIIETASQGRLLVNAPLLPHVTFGDIVDVTCKIQQPENDIEGFNYARYLVRDHIFAVCWYPTMTLHGHERSIRRAIILFKENLIMLSQTLFPEPENSLLVGILLGSKQGQSDAWRDALQKTGTTHIVVASGFNVTIILLFATSFFGKFLSPKGVLVIAVMLITFFTVLAGLEPSIIRAGLMGSLAAFGKVLGKRVDMMRLLLLAVLIMLLFDPYALVYDMGFQLSFAATAGLVLLSAPVSRVFKFLPDVFALRESFVTTVAATLTTLPLVAVAFGYWSPLALLVNPLILGMVPIAMVSGALALMSGLITLPLAKVLAMIAWIPLQCMTEVIIFFGQLNV